MNKLIPLLFAVLSCSAVLNAQTTCYYKLIKQIVNGLPSTNVSGGQFISFMDDKCYESDKEGYSVGNGVMKYEYTNSTNGIILYVGKSYWGASSFLFSSDMKKLNVKVNENKIYVYHQETPPIGQSTCSLIRENSASPVSPVVIDGQPVLMDDVMPLKPEGRTIEKPSIRTRRQKDCPSCFGGKCSVGHAHAAMAEVKMFCNGTGKCGWCDGRGYNYVGTKKSQCSACMGNKKCKTCHGTGKCHFCGGTGYR